MYNGNGTFGTWHVVRMIIPILVLRHAIERKSNKQEEKGEILLHNHVVSIFRGKDRKNVEMSGARSRRALWSHEPDEKLRN